MGFVVVVDRAVTHARSDLIELDLNYFRLAKPWRKSMGNEVKLLPDRSSTCRALPVPSKDVAEILLRPQ